MLHDYQNEVTFKEFNKTYFSYIKSLLDHLDLDILYEFFQVIEDSRKMDRMIFIAGNGGSAATASHMANDLSIGILKGVSSQKPYKVISLTDNTSVITALGNDIGYESIFVAQLENLFKSGDVFIAISASGNSPNLLEAAKWVKAHGGIVMSFVGFDGGLLRSLSDVCIHINTPKGYYGPVEDIHLILDHVLHAWARKCALSEEPQLSDLKTQGVENFRKRDNISDAVI